MKVLKRSTLVSCLHLNTTVITPVVSNHVIMSMLVPPSGGKICNLACWSHLVVILPTHIGDIHLLVKCAALIRKCERWNVTFETLTLREGGPHQVTNW